MMMIMMKKNTAIAVNIVVTTFRVVNEIIIFVVGEIVFGVGSHRVCEATTVVSGGDYGDNSGGVGGGGGGCGGGATG